MIPKTPTPGAIEIKSGQRKFKTFFIANEKAPQEGLFTLPTGGNGGIRTRGGYNPTHAFQACDLNRSSTFPRSF